MDFFFILFGNFGVIVWVIFDYLFLFLVIVKVDVF